MKQNFKDFLFNLAMSMLIGLFVGMVEITVVNMDFKNAEELIICSIIGGIIGTISRLVFMYIFEMKQKDVKTAFVSVFIIIGIISCLPFLYHKLIYGSSISIVELSSIFVAAELFGMSFCYYSYKRCLTFNLKLVDKKMQLLNRKS